MDADKLDNIKDIILDASRLLFRIFTLLCNVLVIIFFVFGAGASLVLLYKMFPDTAMALLTPLFALTGLFLKIFKIFILAFIILLYSYLVIWLCQYIAKNVIANTKIRNKREEKRVYKRPGKGNE